jgi:isopenicillin N synthase-like dioxygenase
MSASLITVADRPEKDAAAFARELGNSFRENRVALLTEHGIDSALVNNKLKVDQALFADPATKALRAKDIESSGYFPPGKEYAASRRLGDPKHMWHVVRELTPDHPRYKAYPKNFWPEVQGFREASLALYRAYDALATRLLSALEVFLQVEKGFLVEKAKDGNNFLRTNYYPAREKVVGEFGEHRNHAHTDINFITLMFAPEASGYEYQNAKGEWQAAKTTTDTIIVNTGKMMGVTTNGFLMPAWHRVVGALDTSQERWSLPFFVRPVPEAILTAHPNFVGEGFPVPLTAVTMQEFRTAFLGNDPKGIRPWMKENLSAVNS